MKVVKHSITLDNLAKGQHLNGEQKRAKNGPLGGNTITQLRRNQGSNNC